jgi:hypothetical protein
VVALGAAGGAAAAILPWNGRTLPAGERSRLLRAAGLPPDFPIHPDARRMSQPDQGGLTYSVREPVPDVLIWQTSELESAGYQVYRADVRGQDEFLPHWVYFTNDSGASGAIIIRRHPERFAQSTEVKVLSRTDARLQPPPLPTGAVRP